MLLISIPFCSFCQRFGFSELFALRESSLSSFQSKCAEWGFVFGKTSYGYARFNKYKQIGLLTYYQELAISPGATTDSTMIIFCTNEKEYYDYIMEVNGNYGFLKKKEWLEDDKIKVAFYSLDYHMNMIVETFRDEKRGTTYLIRIYK